MPRTLVLYLGAAILFIAVGIGISDEFFSHYREIVRHEQVAALRARGEVVPPFQLRPVAAEHLSLVIQPDDGIEAVRSKIARAQHTIDLVIYKMSDAHTEQALGDAVARGVRVRVLLNGGYYSKKEQSNDAVYARLEAMGVSVRWAPTHFALTHQKTFIFDGGEALIMTHNLQEKYYVTSRDFAVVTTNPNDVAAIQTVFEADWNGRQISEPQGDDLVWSPGAEETLLYLINSATSSLRSYNQLMEDEDIIFALIAAAERGVEVQVLMTYETNWKPALTRLTQGGVHVRTYASTSKLRYIHTKVIVVDGNLAFVGSQNYSENSLNKNRELGIIVQIPALLEKLISTFSSDWAGARPFIVVKQ